MCSSKQDENDYITFRNERLSRCEIYFSSCTGDEALWVNT
jgi:hypothetical protein